jgi:precorrin-6B methylase 2
MSNRTAEIFNAFNDARTDKGHHGYAMIYDKVPVDIASLVEIGVQTGASLLAWTKIFPEAMIYGIDRNEATLNLISRRICMIQADIQAFSPDTYNWRGGPTAAFDLIIDDGSHLYEDILAGWRKFYTRCRGLYVIEDVELEHVGPLLAEMEPVSAIISAIQTGEDPGSRVVVAQFNRVIPW